MIDALYNWGAGLIAAEWWSGAVWILIWTLLKIVVVLLPLMGAHTPSSHSITVPPPYSPLGIVPSNVA